MKIEDMSVMWYRIDAYNKLKNVSNNQKLDILKEISKISEREPFWMEHTRKFVLKSYDNSYKFTGLQMMAWMYELTRQVLNKELNENSWNAIQPLIDEKI